jgi:hypothetical protein
MISWNIHCDTNCSLCSAALETREHLFFKYDFSLNVWRQILKILKIQRQVYSCDQEIMIAAQMCGKKEVVAQIYGMCFTEFLYAIWLERNARRFQHKEKDWMQVYREILDRVSCRATEAQRLLLIM